MKGSLRQRTAWIVAGGLIAGGCATTSPLTGPSEGLATQPGHHRGTPLQPSKSADPSPVRPTPLELPPQGPDGRPAPEPSPAAPWFAPEVTEPVDAAERDDESEVPAEAFSDESFDAERWLAARGVEQWPVDGACWERLADPTDPDEPAINECLCRGTVTVGQRSLLWCQRPHRLPEATAVPFVTHTVLYAVDRGGLQLLLDVPTSTASTDCKAAVGEGCWVSLVLRGGAGGLRIGDGPAGSCEAALTELGERIRRGEPQLVELRSVYRRVCASRGRYHLRDGALVQEFETLGVRRFGP